MKCVTSSTLSRMEYMAGRDTLHGSKTTDGQSSDSVDITRMDKTAGRHKTRWRENLIRHMGPAWPRIARDRRQWRYLGRGSSLLSDRNPGGKW